MRRGFTLLELIVVVALLAIVASMVVPRLTGMIRREGDLTAERLTELLSMFAFRDNTGSQQCALWMNPDSGCVEIWNMESNPDRPADPPDWVPDRLVQPVRLPTGVELTEVRRDGELLAPEEWRIIGSPSADRPRVEMLLTAEGFQTLLVLEPGATIPIRIDQGVVKEGGRVAIDLDQQGRDREPW